MRLLSSIMQKTCPEAPNCTASFGPGIASTTAETVRNRRNHQPPHHHVRSCKAVRLGDGQGTRHTAEQAAGLGKWQMPTGSETEGHMSQAGSEGRGKHDVEKLRIQES